MYDEVNYELREKMLTLQLLLLWDKAIYAMHRLFWKHTKNEKSCTTGFFKFRGFIDTKLTMQYKRFPITPLSDVCLLAQQAELKSFFNSRALNTTLESKKLYQFLEYPLYL